MIFDIRLPGQYDLWLVGGARGVEALKNQARKRATGIYPEFMRALDKYADEFAESVDTGTWPAAD